MQLTIEQLADNVTRAVLAGRLDVAGAAAVDLRLNAIAGSGRPTIVDLTQVEFLSSMGIRTLLVCAKANKLKGGRLVLLGPPPLVALVLQTSGIDRVISVHHDIEAAISAVTAS